MEWTRDLGRTWEKTGPLNDRETGAIQGVSAFTFDAFLEIK